MKNVGLNLVPVSKWNEHFTYPSVGAIRQFIFYNTNDFNNSVIRKIGKRLYIKVSAFYEWVEENGKEVI